ncbi:ankyrin repeat and fibronectin type-III domain-containing protein 1-like isoform X3 [Hydractinia symbiolongicarpus]|uniref:ankyrin repeat and fibronectin type-III domain-containing protein 1-like isoform X3 n=1 Tax=Hydractinia symbiolongicarpus TaxID=13093 RepID=UPI00254AB202|nr:ankyrin repeat and fibronectin type-III domain-containing protein 1-like isoform X3 [Hydractinia symbiolongicarpus]
MLATHLDNNALPTPTTNFLSPCNEELHDEHMPISKNPVDVKKPFGRSNSCDVIPKKPHPFRSPITFLRTGTMQKWHRKQSSVDAPDYNTRLKTLTVSPSHECRCGLDEDILFRCNTSTTDNTPFERVSNHPYYQRRQTFSHNRRKKSSREIQEEQTLDQKHPNKLSEDEELNHTCLRRRASSLDFLPEAIHKSTQNGTAKTSPFARTTSMSQRSPFRRKSPFTDSDTSITALFDAIERQEVDEVRKMINIMEININEVNPDQFTPLDVALMCGETEIATILLNHGGKENPVFLDPSERAQHLETLIENADKNVNDYTATIVNCIGDAKDNERQLREWEWRLYMLRVMQNGFFSTEKPLQSPSVALAPLSNEAIVVSLSSTATEGDDMITKHKVEWSRMEDFSEIVGQELITDKRVVTCTIKGLEANINWYVRVQSGNIKGFSPYGYPEPRAVKPSSWHECDNSVPRYYGASDKLCSLVDRLHSFQKHSLDKHSDDTSDDDSPTSPQALSRSPKPPYGKKKVMMKRVSKYTNLIFNSAPKLLKKIKGRGIYLAALLYNDDLSRVLVTMDENLPVVECDENYSKSFNQEFYWFSKASCTWEDIQHMLFFSNKSHSSQSVQIRRKLLQSALVLMNATGVNDLGPIHYKPFKDAHGSILLLTVNCIKKSLSGTRALTMKWIPIQKLLKKTNSINEQVIVPERLIPSVQDQVTCHRRSRMHLPKGLYLGYLKLRTTMDTLSVIVPNSHTNVLPYVKIQDVPNVTKEEWKWLKNKNRSAESEDDCEGEISPNLRTFEKRLKNAVNKLFSHLNIPTESFMSHRIYDQEVIELNSEVLFILICPSADSICTPPNQTDHFSNLTAYSALPVQAFEMANMMTYQPKVMSSYSRLSSILELENFCTQQALRETICHNEGKNLKEREAKLLEIQQSVDELWRSSRWVLDTLQSCQDKNSNIAIPLSAFYKSSEWSQDDHNLSVSSISTLSDDSSEHDECRSCDVNDIKTDLVLTIYATSEVGLSETCSTEVNITETTTTQDIIQIAAKQFLKDDVKLENDGDGGDGLEILSSDNLDQLVLVVVSGSRERCLRNDLNLMNLQNPWEKGTLHLRLKKDALRATKWGLSTAV